MQECQSQTQTSIFPVNSQSSDHKVLAQLSACWMSLWELMKPRNSGGKKERKKWRKREARQEKKGHVMQRCHSGAWAMQPSLATGVAGDGGDSDLSCCWAPLRCLTRALVDEHPLVRADPPDGYVVSPPSLAFPSWQILGSEYQCHGLKWELPAWCQTLALSCITKASDSAQRTQEAWWQQFKTFMSFCLQSSLWASNYLQFQSSVSELLHPRGDLTLNHYCAFCVHIELESCYHQGTHSFWVFWSSHWCLKF